ncbi:cytochrome P450 [Glycocaulis alkaliphilus]|nr:cytochrome P450 [Glycocaulis alkaliphilus]
MPAKGDADMTDSFQPARVTPLEQPTNLLKTGMLMRENPLSILPALLFEKTILTGPYLGRSVHHVSGPAEMKSVLQDNFEDWCKSPLIQRMLRPVLGDAILTAHGENWRRQRMTLQPAFLKRRLDPFAPIMAEAALMAVERLKHPQTPEIMSVMSDATFAVIERVLFSDVEGFDRGEVRRAIEVLLEEIGQMRLSDLAPVPEWMPRMMTRRAVQARKVFRKAVEGQIARRRAAADPGSDLLGLLLTVRDEETGEGLSDTDIRDSVMTFVAAGHETTGIALTWALYLLANQPQAQARLREEAKAVLGDGPATAEHVSQLYFTRQVLEEAMRLYPPAPMVARRAVRATEICGRPVRKGDVALLAFYCLHRHTTLWDNPDSFDPDRWLRDRRPTDRYQFLAFGGGPRACIGMGFAMMEATIMLATLVRELAFSPPADARPVELAMQVTLRPAGGLHLIVKPA